MKKVAEVGSYCPYKGCNAYGEVEQGNVIKYGKSNQGVQRYYCNSCKTPINANYGTMFYRKRTSAKEIIEVLVLIANGSNISAIVEAKGYKAATIEGWLLEAAEHAEEINALLLKDYDVGPSQIDAMWSFVKHKGSKKGDKKKVKTQEHSGVAQF